jgi:hypothetical protein
VSSIIVPGRLVSPTQIELSRPINVSDPAIEVEVRERSANRDQALADLMQFMMSRPAGTRTKEDIDRQIEEERNSWDNGR